METLRLGYTSQYGPISNCLYFIFIHMNSSGTNDESQKWGLESWSYTFLGWYAIHSHATSLAPLVDVECALPHLTINDDVIEIDHNKSVQMIVSPNNWIAPSRLFSSVVPTSYSLTYWPLSFNFGPNLSKW